MYNPLVKALFNEVNPIPVKEALNIEGLSVGIPRLPLTPCKEETKDFAKSDEDVLSYALFPQVAKKFFDIRDGKVEAPASASAPANGVREIFVQDLS